jgi:hypothetical protein
MELERRYTFSEISNILMNVWYNYEDIPDFVRQTAEYFQYLDEIAVTGKYAPKPEDRN